LTLTVEHTKLPNSVANKAGRVANYCKGKGKNAHLKFSLCGGIDM